MSSPLRQTNHWGPVLRGLIIDPQAKHFLRMKQAIWLYLYLIVAANQKTGKLISSLSAISSENGIREETLQSWLGHLKKHGYVVIEKQGDLILFRLTKWSMVSKLVDSWNSQVEVKEKKTIKPQRSAKTKGDESTNDEKGVLKTEAEEQATRIAKEFNDEDNVEYYRSLCRDYPEKIIKKALDTVQCVPDNKIKKSRGALFTYLVKKYASQQKTKNPGD